jgi:hypothetical protein
MANQSIVLFLGKHNYAPTYFKKHISCFSTGKRLEKGIFDNHDDNFNDNFNDFQNNPQCQQQ